MRKATIRRQTAETDIFLTLDLDGSGKGEISSGIGFLDHMLRLLTSHGRFDLTLTCRGDLEVDGHHTTEDIGIALGEAFAEALGNKAGIRRYGDVLLPMDEALIASSVDFSGRDYLGYRIGPLNEKVGTFDTELVEEFFLGFVRNARCSLHLVQLSGKNTHHIIEGAFKAFARSLREAVTLDPAFSGEIPSTKGVL
ncbi:MAG: imidazoleglycerol-phosphate dehydratase HisB [Clostridia bacterium]|nr:imidazoleglycerol-phosphate dehydratase HisB [Clostridia bacterium]